MCDLYSGSESYYIVHTTTYYIDKAFSILRCVNLATLPLVRCYSIRLARSVATSYSWVNYSMQLTESAGEH